MEFLKKLFSVNNDSDAKFDRSLPANISTNSRVTDEEVQRAIEAVQQAKQHMDFAEPVFLDAAIRKVDAADAYLNALLKYKKAQA